MVRSVLLVGLAFGLFASTARGGLILQVISGPDANSSSAGITAVGVGLIGFSRGPGIATESPSATFNSTSFTLNGTEIDAVLNGDYIEWSFTSTSSYNLDDFDLRYDRSPSGPSSLRVDFNANNSGFTTVLRDAAISDAGENAIGISMSSFDGITSGTFRLYAWGATNTTGTFDFENASAIGVNQLSNPVSFELNATLTAVPEPSSMLLLGLAGVTVGVGRRWRQKRMMV